MKRRRFGLAMLAIGLVVALAACNPAADTDKTDHRRTLRIGMPYGSPGEEAGLRERLTDKFELLHPEIDIEFVFSDDSPIDLWGEQDEEPDPLETLKKLMTGSQPADLVVFSLDQLPALVRERLLLPLDSRMADSGIDPAEFVPAVIEAIRERGDGGQLYALSPTFSASALFYNKALFLQRNVPFPTDGMTWEDALILARRFASGSGEDAVYGITFSPWGIGDPFAHMNTYAEPLQLRMFDDKAERMTVRSSGWEEVWSTFRSLYEEAVLPPPEGEPAVGVIGGAGEIQIHHPYRNRPFFTGKAAMTVGDFGLIHELAEFNRNAGRLGLEPVDWGVVTLPVHPQRPDTGLMSISELMGINVNASNPDDAWAFIRFFHGETNAKLLARHPFAMSTLQSANKVPDGMDYDPAVFYRLKPGPGLTEAESRLYREYPDLLLVRSLGSMVFERVISGELTVEEGLEEWERKGNELLQKIRQASDGDLDSDMTDSGEFILPPADGVDEGQFVVQP